MDICLVLVSEVQCQKQVGFSKMSTVSEFCVRGFSMVIVNVHYEFILL